jgi:hypothetical protein
MTSSCDDDFEVVLPEREQEAEVELAPTPTRRESVAIELPTLTPPTRSSLPTLNDAIYQTPPITPTNQTDSQVDRLATSDTIHGARLLNASLFNIKEDILISTVVLHACKIATRDPPIDEQSATDLARAILIVHFMEETGPEHPSFPAVCATICAEVGPCVRSLIYPDLGENRDCCTLL